MSKSITFICILEMNARFDPASDLDVIQVNASHHSQEIEDVLKLACKRFDITVGDLIELQTTVEGLITVYRCPALDKISFSRFSTLDEKQYLEVWKSIANDPNAPKKLRKYVNELIADIDYE
jgi:hypothetical protein